MTPHRLDREDRTHFARVPMLTTEEAERLIAEMETQA